MSWLSEIAHDQATVTLFAAIGGMIVGLAGAGVALIIGWRQGTSSRMAADAAKAAAEASTITARASERTARAAGDRAIATMRLQWVQDLRRILAEYHSVLVSYEKEDYRKVSELGTHLDLMLNLDEPEQKALWDVAERMFRTKDKDERVRMDPELMAAGRLVLKKEWQKIKLEQQGLSQ